MALKELRNWGLVAGAYAIPPGVFGYVVERIADNPWIGAIAGVTAFIGWAVIMSRPAPNAHMPDGWTPYQSRKRWRGHNRTSNS